MTGENTARPLNPTGEKQAAASTQPSLQVVAEKEKPMTWDDLLKLYPGLALQGSALLAIASALASNKTR